MKKKRLELTELKVQSFVTRLSNSNTIKSGVKNETDVPILVDDSGFGVDGQSADATMHPCDISDMCSVVLHLCRFHSIDCYEVK